MLSCLAAGALAQSASAPVPTSKQPTQVVRPAAAVRVENVDFKRGTDGAAKLTVRFSGEGATPDLRNADGNVIIDLGNASVPANLQQQLNVKDFATPVSIVDTQANRLVLNTTNAFESMAYQHGREYVVEIVPRTTDRAVGSVASAIAGARTAAAAAKTNGYRGRPVNYNFQDVPVRTVLQLLAEDTGLNIVASDTVQGSITIRLNNVPWDQALDVILRAKGLDKRRDGNVIWIAPATEIAKSEQEKEDARIALENRQDLVTEFVRVNYHSAVDIYKAITEAKGVGGQSQQGAGGGGQNQDSGFLSPRGRLVADGRTNTLMISDIPKRVNEMKRLINEIDRPVDQVVIEGRIVIATESFARDLGARFGVGRRGGNNNKWGIGGGDGGARAVVGNPASNTYNFNLPAASTSTAAALGYTLLGANFSLDIELSAMQTEGRGEVLSNPRILTTNQRESVIQQGKQIGYVTVTAGAGGIAMPTVAFKDVFLELRVTPTITNDDRVFLNVKVNKDELDSWLNTSIGQVPIIAKRAIDTAALVENGQTVVIGGVYEFTDQDAISKVPFLADIPIIGNLFKQKSRNKSKAELLIFLTPRILHVKQNMH
ncbi:type IV pilus secretin PilQ [Lysobacter sp. HDW10]|nr:type IV pilus secretin PilQ [Lysobacter sp. HDW10]